MYFALSFILFMAAPLSHAKDIYYCWTIKFNSVEFDYSKIKKASLKKDCRDNPVPIYFKGLKDYFNLTPKAYATGGASYLIWDKVSKNYRYDEDELKKTIQNITDREQKYKYLSNLIPSVNIYYYPRPNGALVISDVIFKDKEGNDVSIIKDAFFYSKDNYAAVYGSQPTKFKEKNKILFLKAVNNLFNTMVIDWG